MLDEIKNIFKQLDGMLLDDKIRIINQIREELYKYSPFKEQPVDCVLWVKNEEISSNDYNPNSVASPEMKLLKLSVSEDGYTMPIVTWKDEDGKLEVIDGFHRSRVGKEDKEIKEKIYGYLPISIVNATRTGKGERMASTIRHNRARGKHSVGGMSDIVIELARRNWSDKKIAKQLGMDADEVLRLKQISGLVDMFEDEEFSMAWEI